MTIAEARAQDPVIKQIINRLLSANVLNPEFSAIKKILIEGVDGRYNDIELKPTEVLNL
jgi:hypothetical protein